MVTSDKKQYTLHIIKRCGSGHIFFFPSIKVMSASPRKIFLTDTVQQDLTNFQ
jgi:hypothetical protein